MYTILVVEDQSLMRAMLCDVLQEAGYQTLEAKDGIEALDLVEKGNVSMLITDLVMPLYDGATLLSMVTECHPELPVLSLTSLSRDNDLFQEAAKIIGEEKIIFKSGNIEEIVDKVKAVLN